MKTMNLPVKSFDSGTAIIFAGFTGPRYRITTRAGTYRSMCYSNDKALQAAIKARFPNAQIKDER